MQHNREVEITLLSDVFQNNDILADTAGTLQSDDFFFTENGILYESMMDMYRKNLKIDPVTFAHHIGQDQLKAAGGVTYLSKIIGASASPANYKQHIQIIKAASERLQFIRACSDALEEAKGETDIKKVIDKLESRIITTGDQDRHKTLSIAEAMEQTLSMIEEGYKNGGKINGVSTGYKCLDDATGGFIPGDLFIVAGRPSMGKTALILQMLNRFPEGHNAMLFELEMEAHKLATRLLAARTRINSKDLSRGKIKDSDFSSIIQKAGEFGQRGNIFINCKSGPKVSDIRAEAKKVKIKHGLSVVMIDHIGKIMPNNPKATRNDQIGQISNDLKNMAKDLNVTVVVLSQLNREVEGKADKRPSLSNLRDSGNIEADADQVLLIYRDDYYSKAEDRGDISTLEILIAKNRDGEVGKLILMYDTNHQIITEPATSR